MKKLILAGVTVLALALGTAGAMASTTVSSQSTAAEILQAPSPAAPGDQGPANQSGDQGPANQSGDQGPTGQSGDQGPANQSGDQGPSGENGAVPAPAAPTK